MTTTERTNHELAQVARRIVGSINLQTANDSVGDGVDLIDMQSVSVQVSGAFTGTLQIEVQNRDGGPWVPKALVSATGNLLSQLTTAGLLSGDLGARRLRVVRTAGTSGTADVEIIAWPMSQANQQATQPVSVSNLPNVAPAVVSGNGRLSNTAIAANGTYTGSTVDRGTNAATYDSRIRPVVRHLAGLTHGHLVLEESLDGATWLETRRSPVPSDGLYHSFDWAVHLRYWRLKFVNGGVLQSAFDLLYQSSRGDGSSVDIKNVLTFPMSNTPLAASGVWGSPVLDLGGNHDWSVIRASYRADQNGAASSMRVDYSDDGSAFWSDASSAGTYAGNSMMSIESKVQARYARLAFTNGATAQAAFRAAATLVSL